jgi:beta-glucanase (GH16 family)
MLSRILFSLLPESDPRSSASRIATGSVARRAGLGLSSAAALTLLGACGGTSEGVPPGEFIPPVVEYRLVFEDEFDGDSLDTSKWNIDEGDGCPDLCDWGNNELQEYSADNITVSGGTLRIEGREEAGGYTSGRINTKGKFDFQYGRVEVSARIPSGKGTWPAIWLLHSDPTIYGPWPLSGEIDIMEAFNYGVDGNVQTRSTTHYGLPIPPFDGTGSGTDLSANADLTFHEYAVEWEKGRIRFFVDGVHFQTQTVDEYYTYYPADDDGFYDEFSPYNFGLEDAPFDQAFHLLINFAIGGNPVGPPDAETIFPQTMEIDYVRVYECANSNPESRRGCGTADPAAEVLKDLDGGPLEDAVTEKPYVEELPLYLDGPETITVTVGDLTGSNTLEVDGFTGDGATVISDPAFPDPEDDENTVWRVGVAGGVANVYLKSQDLADDELLDTGFDFSGEGLGGEPVGEVAFDLNIQSATPGTDLLIKLDSGFPNVGEVALPWEEYIESGDYALGEWRSFSVKFDDLLANPGFVDCCGGQGVDLENVVNPFVFEVQNGDAEVYLDNIRVTNACYVVGACGAGPRTKGLPDLVVFDDAVNTGIWNRGIVASDSGSGFADYTDPSNPANKVNWQIIADADVDRGNVIEVTFNDSGEFGVWFIGSGGPVDTNAYAAGAVLFDIIVDDYGTASGMTMKVDCFFPCTSGDQNLGKIADGVWETVQVPVAQLVAGGLDLDNVNVGVVIFPTTQGGGITFRVDNIRWVAETDAELLEPIDLPVTFDDPAVSYALVDFGGTSSAVVDDPEGGPNRVAQTTHNGGQFAGTIIGTDAGFANPIPFTQTEQTMSIRVRSPAAGIPVMLKVEDAADPNVFAEVIATTTVADAWEVLEFDYTGVIDAVNVTYEKAVLFFNFPNAGDGSVYYWDDVQFGVPPSGADPFLVYDDAPGPAWDLGIFGAESTNGFAGTSDGTAGPVVRWTEVPAADPARGQVIQATMGGVPDQFGVLAIQASGGVDLSAYAGGSVVFDILVTDYDTNTGGMVMKIDCVFPCTSGDKPLGVVGDGAWQTISVPVAELVAGLPGGTGLNLQTVNTGLVVFPHIPDQQAGATVTFQIDNVRWEPDVLTDTVVYDDAANLVFDLGIFGAESTNGFAGTSDGTAGPVVTWAEVAAADPNRGTVIAATMGGVADQFGVLAIQSSAGLDLSAYDQGAVVFDILVTDYGANTGGMVMKIDCVFPCTSGDKPLGVVGDGVWQTISVEITELVAGLPGGTGLNLQTVNTGIVIFPHIPDQQAGATVNFQIDNVRWEP